MDIYLLNSYVTNTKGIENHLDDLGNQVFVGGSVAYVLPKYLAKYGISYKGYNAYIDYPETAHEPKYEIHRSDREGEGELIEYTNLPKEAKLLVDKFKTDIDSLVSSMIRSSELDIKRAESAIEELKK